ncbi:MAG: T9SS type A sorting domain-containing protein, partial [Bacteroidota bacterium]
GGGGNYGMGGIGSQKSNGACNGDFPGEGGSDLGAFYVAGNSLFLGGGGGAGQSNNETGGNPQGQDGGNGGGIIIIRANLLEGNGFGVYANGADVDFGGGATPVLSDGQGGGGAGGTIVLDINNLGTTALTLEASGGKGGDTNSTFLTGNQNCEGPGGGGGGGAVLTSLAAWGLTPDVTGGAAGAELGTGGGCSPNGQAGSAGAVLFNYSPIIASGSNSSCGVVLSASIENASAQREGRAVSLRWQIAGTESLRGTSVQRLAADGQWLTLVELPIDETQTSYRYLDHQRGSEAVIYRIGLTAHDGGQVFSPRLWVDPTQELPLDLQIFPNPASTQEDIWLETSLATQAPWQLEIYDLTGKRVWQRNYETQRVYANKLNLESLNPGVYQLVLKQGGQRLTRALHLFD